MNISKFINENHWIVNIGVSIIVIIIGVILYFILTNLLFKSLDKKAYQLFKSKKSNTYAKLIRSISRYLFILVIFFIVLRINGINITSMVTGVGVIGIIFSFTIQDALKDIIKGFDIITDSYYQVGDVIRVDKYSGVVIAIGIKTTKIEDIYEKNIVSISNRNIEKVEVLSHMININIPLPYELKLEEAEKTIKYIIKELKKIKTVENVEYHGINEFASSSINYHIKIYALPINKVQTRRDALTKILKCLEDNNITIPYNQLEIHQK